MAGSGQVQAELASSHPAGPGRPDGRALGLLVLCLLVGLCVIALLLQRSAPIEASRAELALRDGRLYRTCESQPFTGSMVEKYPDGTGRSRSAISAGLLHGISEGCHTNGALAVREHFREGVSHGVRTKWYASGAKMSEATIAKGQLHGTFKSWHENGAVAEQIEMRNGDPDGLSLAYYPSGFLKAQVRLQAGKPIEQQFWKDGETKSPTVASSH
jgi:antitoxin component YwqK of YwqJK toxin-antitoxin module